VNRPPRPSCHSQPIPLTLTLTHSSVSLSSPSATTPRALVSVQLCIGGIIDSGSHSINIAESSRADAANNAYVGAAIYAAFVGASIIMYFFGRWRSRTLAAANASAQPLLENRY